MVSRACGRNHNLGDEDMTLQTRTARGLWRPTRRHWLVIQWAILSLTMLRAGALEVAPDLERTDAAAGASARQAGAAFMRPWSVADIVEINRVQSITVNSGSNRTAFVMREPSLEEGRNKFALYSADSRTTKQAGSLLLEAAYIADVSWHPGTDKWSIRADIGHGVQLYDVTERGELLPLVINDDVADVGGNDGLQYGDAVEPRPTGVLSYEWSPDGLRLWYSRLGLRSPREQAALLDHGIVYDDTTMIGASLRDAQRQTRLVGTELHVFDPATRSDRTYLTAAPDAVGDSQVLRRPWGSAAWVDSAHIQYWLKTISTGLLEFRLWRLDLETGTTTQLAPQTVNDVFNSVPTKAGYLTVRNVGASPHLIDAAEDGRAVRDYGGVTFSDIGGELGAWASGSGDRVVLNVKAGDHDTLVTLPSPTMPRGQLRQSTDQLGPCAVNAGLSYAVCNRESIQHAPELVRIDLTTGAIAVLYRPNARYDNLQPLRVERRNWTNKYGFSNDGYVIFPRHYVEGRKYPTLLITHAHDAGNRFVIEYLQWEYPAQVFAERDYIVVLVNEPRHDPGIPSPGLPGAEAQGAEREQFYQGFNPLASLEAVATSLVQAGLTEPGKIGIAGYSRGAALASFAISQSTLFSAASIGDGFWWSAGGFWQSKLSRNSYLSLFGGSPFQDKAYQRYRAFSVSARTESFAGPLLQQYTGLFAPNAVELSELLTYSGVPTELIFFPGEAHIFWNPRHRAAAMQQNLDWFDYWLLGRRDQDTEKSTQYDRWSRMALQWRRSHPATSNAVATPP
jgi:dipeptidyl aminopeptidase/acylaminoacyl peptidase